MANKKIEGIYYSNLENASKNGTTGIGVKTIGNAANPASWLEDGDIATKLVNAVEIDWNDAKLGNNVDSTTLTPGEEIIIQTTGQLLSYMSTIAQTTEN